MTATPASRRLRPGAGWRHNGRVAATLESPDFPARLRSREEDAIREVVKTYLRQVIRACRWSGFTAAQAEEIAQDTFTTFVETAGRFEGRSHVRTWLFGIVFRKMAEARRALGRERRHDEIDSVMESRFDRVGRWQASPAGPEDLLYGREIRESIEACLEETPVNQRMAFLLREVENLPPEEICKILDVSRTNLRVLLFRARNRLRECLAGRGIQPR